ncbi:MAG: TonB family protein [Acidobacteriia bacterium]|nr:TonB family protein [Terriglobia bacterium]
MQPQLWRSEIDRKGAADVWFCAKIKLKSKIPAEIRVELGTKSGRIRIASSPTRLAAALQDSGERWRMMSVDLITTKQLDGKHGRSSRKRIETLTYVDLGPGNGGMLIDISEGGVSFQGIKPLETDELLPIIFKLPTINDFIRVTGQVIWLNGSGKGGGLRFVELPQTAERLIKEWVSPQSTSHDRAEKTPASSRADETNQFESSPALPMMAKRDRPSSKANGSVSEPLRDSSFSPSTATDAAKVSGSMVTGLGLKDSTSTSGFPGPTVKTERSANGITLFALGIFASLATVLVLGAIFYQSHRGQVLSASKARTEPASDLSLGLKLERSGKDWQIGWSRNADVVVKAIGGHLSITDGQNHKELDLDPGELRSGSIVYTPVTDSVVVRLQVVGGNSAPPVSESVRVIAGIAPVRSPDTQTPESLPGKSTESRLKVSSTVPSIAGVLGSSEKQAPTVPRETLATSVKTDPRKFERMAGNLRPATPFASATSRANEVGLPTVAIPVQPESGPNVSAFVPGPQPPAPPASLSPARGREVDPAQLIERKAPVYPAAAQQNHISGSVELSFHIGADGRVNHVNVVKGNPLLARAAVEAVQLWHYKAARVNGIPVESESSTVIVFQPN